MYYLIPLYKLGPPASTSFDTTYDYDSSPKKLQATSSKLLHIIASLLTIVKETFISPYVRPTKLSMVLVSSSRISFQIAFLRPSKLVYLFFLIELNFLSNRFEWRWHVLWRKNNPLFKALLFALTF